MKYTNWIFVVFLASVFSTVATAVAFSFLVGSERAQKSEPEKRLRRALYLCDESTIVTDLRLRTDGRYAFTMVCAGHGQPEN